jgi:hypothetical protein
VAVAALVRAEADARFVVGPAASTVRFDAQASGTFGPWGLELRVGADHSAAADLPLSLTVGAWMLDRAGGAGVAGYQSIAADADLGECRRVGAGLAAAAERVVLLVMGDGSGRRGVDCPGTPDSRADSFDAGVAAALATGDTATLLSIDPTIADELLVAGRPAWQVLAAAVGTAQVRATLRYAGAPYGVGYFVASWTADRGHRPGPGRMGGGR